MPKRNKKQKPRPGGEILRDLRTRLGLTQQQVADRTGMDRIYICQLEIGRHRMGERSAKRLLGAFPNELKVMGVGLAELLPD